MIEPEPSPPRRLWRVPLLLVSVGLHGALVAAVVIADAWHIERLTPDAPAAEVHIALPVALAGGGDVPQVSPPRPRAAQSRTRRAARTSPVRPSTAAAAAAVVAVRDAASGPAGDDAAPVVGPGTDAAATGDAPASVGRVLESLRVAGETRILPPTRVRAHMTDAGLHEVRGVVRICLDADGTVASTRMLRSTGHRDYDGKLLAAVAAWRYRPYTVDGRAMPVCGTVRFVYLQA